MTARKQADEALRESETRFRALADNIAQLAWMADSSGSMFWYNRRWYDYTGTTQEMMQGQDWTAVHHPDHAARVSKRFAEFVHKAEPWEDTFPLCGADGRYRWFLSRAVPVRDGQGGVVFWCGTHTDVTDIRDAESALRESEHLRRAALSGAPLVLWAMDSQGVITLAEGSGLTRAGLTQDDYIGRSVFEMSNDAALQDAWRRSLAGEDAAYNTANGGVLFHNEVRPQRDATGAVTGVIGVAFDVTEREAATAALREAAVRQKGLLRDVLASVTEGKLLLCRDASELPPPLTPVGPPIPLTHAGGLRDLRLQAKEAAQDARHTDERQHDLLTAASEAGMNAVTHGGGGTGQVSLGADGTVQVRVEDQGAGIDMANLPQATLARGFSTKATLGHGLKLMIETADRLFLLTGPEGTTIVLEQEQEKPLPAWL